MKLERQQSDVMPLTGLDQEGLVTVNEFREILDDVLAHFPTLEPTEIEIFSYYLLQALGSSGTLNGNDRDDYIRVIYNLLWERFPDYYRTLFFGPTAN
jgi:hypothetical protein